MLIFLAIALGAFLLVGGSFLFGGDHDADHSMDHDHGDMGHDGDVAAGEPTISIFSTKVIGALLMGFGAAGAIAKIYQLSTLAASLIGLLSGGVLAALMYGVLTLLYRQQASSLIATSAVQGCCGSVTVSIGEGSLGEVAVCVNGQYNNYTASSKDGVLIPKGQAVRVVKVIGSQLIVEKAPNP